MYLQIPKIYVYNLLKQYNGRLDIERRSNIMGVVTITLIHELKMISCIVIVATNY